MRYFALAVFWVALLLFATWAQEHTDKPEKKEFKGEPAAIRVFYTGEVQGVGFRDTAVAISMKYPVKGWVKNLPDGRVELLAEGPADGLKEFLAAIRKRWKENVTKEERTDEKVTGQYKRFEVTR